MKNHRKAPRPQSMQIRATKGTCRWCAQPCPPRRTWHLGRDGEPNCLREYNLINDPGFTRAAVLARDKGICARCGGDSQRLFMRWVRANRYCRTWSGSDPYDRDFHLPAHREHRRERLRSAAQKRLATMGKGWANGAWQHDHIRPLVEANGNIDFWKLDNCQTLCGACHVTKGREDNARRKAMKRTGVQLALI